MNSYKKYSDILFEQHKNIINISKIKFVFISFELKKKFGCITIFFFFYKNIYNAYQLQK